VIYLEILQKRNSIKGGLMLHFINKISVNTVKSKGDILCHNLKDTSY